MTTLTPFLWYDTDVAEAIAYYGSIFPTMRVLEQGSDSGSVSAATIELFGQRLTILNGGPVHAGFKESFSLLVAVETQDEIDELWSLLTADGGEEGHCGWLKDRYGLSWQIVPDRLGSLIGGPDPARASQAVEAMMGMHKLNLGALEAAYER